MDYLKTIDDIIKQMKKNNQLEKTARIISLKESSFTSTELLMSVVHELLQMIKDDSVLKTVIGNEVIQLKKYCYSVGLNIK